MLRISALEVGSQVSEAATFAPENTTVPGLKLFEFFVAFPLNTSVPEREEIFKVPPAVVQLFVMILGMASVYTMLPVVVFATSQPKFPRT